MSYAIIMPDPVDSLSICNCDLVGLEPVFAQNAVVKADVETM